jgi:hypothetical protein
VVALGVLGAPPEPHPLHPARLEHPAVAQAVGVLEVPGHDVGDPLDVAVGMHRPDRARDERVMIEDPQGADPHVVRVSVLVEAEVPAGPEPAAVDVEDRGIPADAQRRQARAGAVGYGIIC